MFSTLYKLELKLISKRTKAGLTCVRAQGKKIGGWFKLNEKQHKEPIKLYKKGVLITHLAKRFGVSGTTIYRYLWRAGILQRKK